ncbi:MAG: penicillin-binding protein 2 [Acidobacteriota bacterium]
MARTIHQRHFPSFLPRGEPGGSCPWICWGDLPEGQSDYSPIRTWQIQADLYGGDIVGKTGIERVYEDELQGLKGFKRVVVNSRGRVVQELGMDRSPRHGRDIRLTLDLGLQQVLERSLKDKVGAAVFLNPWNGEVLAMASAPAFEPNLFARRFPPRKWHDLVADAHRPLQNRATLSHYSPGSTFKLVVAAAALEAGIITPSTTIDCPGYAVIYGHRFHCHKRSGHGQIDLTDAIVHSCNVYFYKVGKTLGIERLAREARRLGLGEKTGVDLVFENAGLVPTPEWKRTVRGQPWYPGETISVAIGEGPLSVTPLQMARMAAMLANGGRKITPHLRMRGLPAAVRRPVPQERTGGFRRQTREALTRAMVEVVSRGTALRVSLPGIQVAAKTGTAQFSSRSVGVDADRLPYEIRDHAWLIGFAPAESPTIAFAVFIEHGGHGGTVAAPVARQVLAHFFGLVAGEKTHPLLARTGVGRGESGAGAP